MVRLPLGCKPSAAVDCHLKTTTLFGIGYLGSVILIADATLFPGSITAMTTASGAAKVKRANGSGFCCSSCHVERSQTDGQHGKFDNKFFRVHTSRLLSNEKILPRQKGGEDGRCMIFLFPKSMNGKAESLD